MDQMAFDAAVSRLAEAVASANEVNPSDFAEIFDQLERWVNRKWPSLEALAEDVVADALTGFVGALRDPSGQETQLSNKQRLRSPAAYLVTAVRNSALSRLRRKEPLPSDRPILDQVDASYEIDDLIDRMVEVEQVNLAIAAAMSWRGPQGQKGDSLATRVLATFLDLAGSSGATPSTRQVAAVARVRHVSVLRVYAQARTFLDDSSAGWPSRSDLRRAKKE